MKDIHLQERLSFGIIEAVIKLAFMTPQSLDYVNNEVILVQIYYFVGNFAGHHCSWCYSPDGIRTKLLSAQRADKPRWGDQPEKLQLPYISGLIKTGKWFDGSKPLGKIGQSMEPDYAPDFVLKNPQKFKELLEPS